MSLNQSRAEKIDHHQTKKPGRSGTSGHQRSFTGGGSGKGGGRPNTTAPPHPSHPPPLLGPSRSFKKSGNGQGGQSRVTAVATEAGNPSSAASAAIASADPRAEQNGGFIQPAPRGASGAPPPNKHVELAGPRGTQPPPKAPALHPSPGAPNSPVPATPPKGEASRGFTVQFGTISPGFVNGMQIPARTSSAPPNLDEQKRDQRCQDSVRAGPAMPIPVAPKQQLRKDSGGIHQTNTGQSHPPPTQVRREMHVQSSAPPPPSAVPKSSVIPVSGMSMPMPFQPPQVPLQFSGVSPQMPSQGVTAGSLPMQIPLSVGNTSQVPQQIFIPGFQSHPLPQGMMHQGQALGFAPQMTHQMAPQMGSLGMGIPPQFPPQQAGKFGGSHKPPVKITHPETHEEVRLDKRMESYSDTASSAPRQHPNLPPQSQPIPSYNQINYYRTMQHGAYNPIFYSAPTSLPLTSTQMATGSQAPRYNYPGSQSGQPVTMMNPSVPKPLPASKPGPQMHGISELTNMDTKAVPNPPGPAQVTVKSSGGLHTEKVVTPSVKISAPLGKNEAVKLSKPLGDNISNSSALRSSESGAESLVQQGKPGPESSRTAPLPMPDKYSTTTVDSVHRSTVESSLPVPVSLVEDSGSVGINAEGRRREPVKRSDSFKDHLKKQSKKDAQQPPPESQADAAELAGGLKLSSVKMPKDSDSDEVDAKQVDRGPDSMQNSSCGEEASISSVSLPSPPVEVGSSCAMGTPQQDDVKSVPLSSITSVATLEVDALEEIQVGDSVSHTEAGVGSQDKEKAPCQTLNPSIPEVAETITQDVKSSCYPNNVDTSTEDIVVKHGVSGRAEQIVAESASGCTTGPCDSRLHPGPIVLESSEGAKQAESNSELVFEENLEKSALSNELSPSENVCTDAKEEAVQSYSESGVALKEVVQPTASSSSDTEFIPSDNPSSSGINEDSDKVARVMNSIISTVVNKKEVADIGPSVPCLEKDATAAAPPPGIAQKFEGRGLEVYSGTLAGPKDKPPVELVRSKSVSGKKKKRKEILFKADAAGTTSDLYLAYKGPVEKQETAAALEGADGFSSIDAKQVLADDTVNDATVNEEDGQSRSEVDDWEDAADTPTLNALENGQVPGPKKHDEYESGSTGKKKYSRDFLLTFQEQCTDLPVDFEIRSDIEHVLSVPVDASHINRDPHPSPGRIIDRPSPRLDRRGSGIQDDDKWARGPISFPPVRDPRLEAGYGGPSASYRSGQGVNQGVLRNPRMQSTNQYNGGVLLGPMQSMVSPGGISRNNVDADRWQRGTAMQRGLIPSPSTPLQIMHKAEKKYEVGKVSDEEEAKQRQLKGILNKLTPQNFDKLFKQVIDVNIDNAVTLTGVIGQIFDKALMEPTFCEMYANFCSHLSDALPDFVEDDEKITFKRVLLNKCQEEFERGEREEAEANRVEEEGETKRSKEEREQKKLQARRRMLGNIRLIGELYKKKMLTERIMHGCIKKLLGEYQNTDEEDVEALCKLMSTIGEMIDHPKAKVHMDAYFDQMHKLSTNQKLSSRVRFMLRDAIDLRKNKWQQRRKVEGPKKIEEVHRDAAQERHLQTSRLARGPSMGSSARRGPPGDYGPRISTQPVGDPRAFSPQLRGFGGQDVRFEDKHLHENRTFSVPLPPRPMDDDSITLGPQGGLARGMSIRGHSQTPSIPLADTGESRRMDLGPNGHGSLSDWTPYGPKEELMPKSIPDRFSGTHHDQLNPQDRNASFVNRDIRNSDRAFDRSISTTPPGVCLQGSSLGARNVLPDTKILSEEFLREKSESAIKEFYSAKDEAEVALCMKELNSPSFFPSMVSLWVTDSFERKDKERELLAKLLVTLCKSHDNLLKQVQLIQGFESVLSTMEDALNDAPKAAEFLGRIFAKMIIEDVVTLREIGKIIHEGGEEPGRLLEIGVASEVLGSTLETIKVEKGDLALEEIRVSSNLHLEDFRSPNPRKSGKLDAFI